MSYSDHAFARASRNTPVRDELVVHLDDIVPELKSPSGISIIKHTKRGQSENRRLRFDTDVATLEVFRTSTNYLNRKILTRTYNLSLLEEVGPATSVPGGLPAAPGRTLVFVFRNRSLYVTVTSRDVCAALVALFRPAGGPLSHASPPVGGGGGGGAGHGGSTARDGEGSMRMIRYESPSSPSSGPSVWGRRQHGRRVSEAAASTRSLEHSAMSVSARNFTAGGRRGAKGGDDGSGQGNGYDGGGTTRRRASHQGMILKRSASYTAGPDSFDMDHGTSTSSSDDERIVVTSMQSRHNSQSAETPPLSGTSGRSPMSTRSSESPDSVMRARMVGFGSADLGMDAKPNKRTGRSSSFKAPWARFTDGEKKGASSSSSSSLPSTRLKSAGLAVEDKAPMADAGQSAGDVDPPAVDRQVEFIDSAAPAPAPHHGRNSKSPLAVRVEDRLNVESLRRPASAPTGVIAATAVSETRRNVQGVQDEAGAGHRSKWNTTTTSPSEQQRRQANSTASPPTRGTGGAPETGSSRAGASQQQVPLAVPLDGEGEIAFSFSARPGSPGRRPMARTPAGWKELGDQKALTVRVVSERKIPPLPRPLPNGQPWVAPKGVVGADEPIYQDSSESSASPPPSRYGVANGARIAVAGTRRAIPPALELGQSSSVDSLEDGGAYHQAQMKPGAADTSASYSEDEGEGETASGLGLPPAYLNGRVPPRDGGATPPDRGRSTRPRDLKGDHGKPPPIAGGKSIVETVNTPQFIEAFSTPLSCDDGALSVEARHATVVPVISLVGNSPGVDAGPIEHLVVAETSDSFGPPTFEDVVSGLTIETASSHESVAPPDAGMVVRPDFLPFSSMPGPNFTRRGSRGSRGSYGRRGSGSGTTDCTSPDSPPGGAVGEVRAVSNPSSGRPTPLVKSLHVNRSEPEQPQAPSGFEELWTVLEPAWGINSSFGLSMTPKVVLLGEIYKQMRNFQAVVASVCVRACGPALGEVCGRCGRAWAVLTSASPQSIAEFKALHDIANGISQLINVVERYEATAVVRRFTLSLIGAPTPWAELLTAGEGGDLLAPCQQIENAIAPLPVEGGRDGDRQSLGGGESGRIGKWEPKSGDLRLPPCPSYWAKGQFDQLTPAGLPDVLTLLHEPARFGELAQLVTRASDIGPANVEYSLAWDCVRQVEGPALGRQLRRALSATLVAAGELLPLPRVPPPPPAYVPREWLTEQIEATILHPFLPLGIAGIGGASGSGKTVLAAAVVRDATVRCRFGDRVFWLHAGKGAHRRLMSLLQALADTVYAWLTNSDRSGSKRGCSGSGRGGSGGDAARPFDPSLREPVRFRDPTQAVNYVADLCRGPLLVGLRCLVVLDDVHERSVVDAIWKSGCQLLITSPVQGLLQAVGAEATIAEPLTADVSRHVAAGAAGEDSLCKEASRLVDLCRGCPLALAMSGAIAQAVLSAGTETREWRKPRTTPKKTSNGDDITQGGGGGGGGLIGSGWSLGIGSTFSNLTAPVGAWVEQVVVGTTSPPQMRPRAKPNDAPSEGSGAAKVVQGGRSSAAGVNGGSAEEAASPQLSMEAMAWTQLTERVDRALTALRHNPNLRQTLAESDVEKELPVREMIAVLTQVALVEADRILGGSGLAIECYLSFALLPEGVPLPPPALEEFWQTGEPPGSGIHATSVFAETQRSPGPVEVLEALRMVGRAGGGEGADGLIPHGLQRLVVLAMAREQPEMLTEMVERRVRILSRVSSLVGTFDDDCWALRGGRSGEKNARLPSAAKNRSGGGKGGSGDKRNREQGRKESECGIIVIPTGLLGSGRPGRPSHGYGGFSRYDHLVASWDVLPADRNLSKAAAAYLSGVREACSRAATRQSSSGVAGGGWAAARALASAADLQALAGQGSEAIPAYGEACALLRAEAKRSAEISGIPRWQRTAKVALHKVACMVEELAVLAAQLGKEAPAIRLLQRAVEMHLSVLEASGALVPGEASVESSRPSHRGNTGGSPREVVAQEAARGRGGGITYRAVADDDRPITSRLRFHRPTAGPVEPSASARGGGGRGGGGGGGGTLPAFGRLDVAATCVEDLGLVVSCARQLQKAKRSNEAVLLAEKLYPILKEILGADHAFTTAALSGLAGQVIVDDCWSQSADTAGALGQHLTLPSPTSRRRLARNYEGRGAASGTGGGSRGGGGTGGNGGGGGGVGGSGGGGGGGSAAGANKKGGSAEASTLAELSQPPFPLPQEFYTRYTDSTSDPSQEQAAARTPVVLGGRPFAGGSGFSGMNDGSTSSGTEGDGGSDSDGAPRGGGPGGIRRAGRVGRGGDVNSGGVAFPGRSYDRPPYGSKVDSQGWRLEGGSTAGGSRDAVEPASTRMQQEYYFRHRTRRARAHAFLITAATRARLKNAVRAEAGLYLVDRARRAGASIPGVAGDLVSSDGEGTQGSLVSPDGGGTQMAKMTALTRRR